MGKPYVYIDRDLCSGGGNCEELAPSVFRIAEDGLAVVHLAGVESIENGFTGRKLLDGEVEQAIQAAKESPGEIINIEM